MRYIVMALFGAILFGTTGTAQAFAPDSATPLSVGSVRMVVGGAGMALVGLIVWWRNPQGRTAKSPRRVWIALIIAGVGMAAYQATFFTGVLENGVAVATVVTLGVSPLMTGLFEWIVRKTKPGVGWWCATVLAITGLTLLVGVGRIHNPVALLWSVAAGAAYSMEVVALKEPLNRGWSSSAVMGWVMGLAALMMVPSALMGPLTWVGTASGAGVALWLGLVTIVVAYLLVGRGLTGLSSATVATIGLAEPATAALLGLFVLHETISGLSWVGIVLIVTGVVLMVAWPARGNKSQVDIVDHGVSAQQTAGPAR